MNLLWGHESWDGLLSKFSMALWLGWAGHFLGVWIDLETKSWWDTIRWVCDDTITPNAILKAVA